MGADLAGLRAAAHACLGPVICRGRSCRTGVPLRRPSGQRSPPPPSAWPPSLRPARSGTALPSGPSPPPLPPSASPPPPRWCQPPLPCPGRPAFARASASLGRLGQQSQLEPSLQSQAAAGAAAFPRPAHFPPMRRSCERQADDVARPSLCCFSASPARELGAGRPGRRPAAARRTGPAGRGLRTSASASRPEGSWCGCQTPCGHGRTSCFSYCAPSRAFGALSRPSAASCSRQRLRNTGLLQTGADAAPGREAGSPAGPGRV
mmetsp:Transcript_13929/g.39442  ORF Transcript_13929/g.39442 Transcript_13929/m.39442 type:complete len:263 (-) Transcript_13929:2811-3599(-)